jgi:hypothetical protein
LRVENHKIYLTRSRKKVLCPLDTKKWILDDGINSYAYGHYKIKELLIKEDPVQCLNIPGRYPLKNESDLTTILDTCVRGSNPSFYSSFEKPVNEESKFFESSIEICKKYGAKTLNQLVTEGYKVEEKPETWYTRYEKGYIND